MDFCLDYAPVFTKFTSNHPELEEKTNTHTEPNEKPTMLIYSVPINQNEQFLFFSV